MANFKLACGICQTEEDVDVVCHHCGMPLCAEHRIRWWDNAFHKRPLAAHCFNCLLANHIRLSAFPFVRPGVKWLWANSATFRAYLRLRGRTPPPDEEKRSLRRLFRRPNAERDDQEMAK